MPIRKNDESYLYVTRKIWGPDDYYFVVSVGDIQVFPEVENIKEGDKVKVTITIEKV